MEMLYKMSREININIISVKELLNDEDFKEEDYI